ncbi:MAG: hypothetical protein ACYCSN_18330 [Acidobacteriaceae bacterium]
MCHRCPTRTSYPRTNRQPNRQRASQTAKYRNPSSRRQYPTNPSRTNPNHYPQQQKQERTNNNPGSGSLQAGHTKLDWAARQRT